MTSVIRYVRGVMGAKETYSVDSTGADYQLVAFNIANPGGVAAKTTATLLKWTGVGTIKAILSVTIIRSSTGQIVPMGAVHSDTHTKVMLDETNRIITITIPEGAMYIPGNSVINLLLAIGNY